MTTEVDRPRGDFLKKDPRTNILGIIQSSSGADLFVFNSFLALERRALQAQPGRGDDGQLHLIETVMESEGTFEREKFCRETASGLRVRGEGLLRLNPNSREGRNHINAANGWGATANNIEAGRLLTSLQPSQPKNA